MDYRTAAGDIPIQRWYSVQDDEVRAAFDATLLTLAATEDWLNPENEGFKVLDGGHVGLGEIRFSIEVRPPGAKKASKRRFRPVGVWRPDSRDFVLLLGCEKSGRIYTPHNAFDLAMDLKADFEQGRGSIHEHVYSAMEEPEQE